MAYSCLDDEPPRRVEAARRETDITFDFDTWAELARTDPERFEALRAKLIRRQIELAPATSRRRLAGLQWRVDCIRSRAGTPLAACMAISGLMWENVLGQEGLVERLRELGQPPGETGRPLAGVVPLHPPRSRRPD